MSLSGTFSHRSDDTQDYTSSSAPPEIETRSDLNASPAQPDRIPGYRLMRKLGGGGMGEVFLACQLFSTPDDALRLVALKAIRGELLTSELHRQIMENDIRIAAQLNHPNIVRILHVGPADGVLYYTMPYLQGGNLAEYIDQNPLPWREAAALLLAITQAVAYLHAQPVPVIHLDLKPGNILLDADGTPQLADFGLARLLHLPDGKCLSHGPGGTPEYMAPEQFDGWVSPACDIYGLGAILYAMLTGQPPFARSTWSRTMRQVHEQEPVPPRTLNPVVDPGLEAVCLKCLEKKPEHRFRNVSELAGDLRRVCAGEAPRALRLGWREWLQRHLGHTIPFGAAATWSTALFRQAVLSLPAYLSIYALLWLESPAPFYWLWLLLVVPMAEWGPYLLLGRRRAFDPREREILLLWLGAAVAKAILFNLNCPLVGPVDDDDILRFFPASMAVNGLMLCLEGRLYLGRIYVFGLLDFAVAIALGVLLDLAPLLYALWNSAVLFGMAAQLNYEAGRQTQAL
jgi:serine/threonine-protein kinase